MFFMETMGKSAGVILPVVVVAVIIALIVGLRKSRPENRQYDERQLALRAEGYRKGFFVTVVAGAIALFLAEMKIIPAASVTLAMFVALMAGIVTFAVFCIVKDVFFHIGEKGTFYRVLCALIVIMDGVVAGIRIADGTVFENGVPTFESVSYLVMALSFLVIFIALMVRRSDREEDE